MKPLIRAWLVGMLMMVTGTALAADPATASTAPKEANIRQGFTLPYKKYAICFNSMGVIREVRVKEGDVVKKDDVLLLQDDTEEQAELKILEFDASNKLPIDAAKANRDAKAVEFKAKDELKKRDFGVDLEWAKAKAELEIAEIQIKQAETELEQKKLKRDKQKTRVDNMKLVAKCDGVILKLNADLGANVDPTKPVIEMLQNNPMTVEVQVPALAALQLKKGEKMRVSYDRKTWREAVVTFLSPQAHAGAGIRVVHLEFENANDDPSGLPIFVELPDKLVVAEQLP